MIEFKPALVTQQTVSSSQFYIEEYYSESVPQFADAFLQTGDHLPIFTCEKMPLRFPFYTHSYY